MNLYEHLEAVEHTSGRTKEEILKADRWETRDLIDSLDDEALISFLVVRRFKDRIEAAGKQL